MKPLRPVSAPGPLYAEDINAAWAELVRLSKLQGGDGVEAEDGPGGPAIRFLVPETKITVRITAVGTPTVAGTIPYSWIQQRPKANGTWEDDLPNGLSGTWDGSLGRQDAGPS